MQHRMDEITSEIDLGQGTCTLGELRNRVRPGVPDPLQQSIQDDHHRQEYPNLHLLEPVGRRAGKGNPMVLGKGVPDTLGSRAGVDYVRIACLVVVSVCVATLWYHAFPYIRGTVGALHHASRAFEFVQRAGFSVPTPAVLANRAFEFVQHAGFSVPTPAVPPLDPALSVLGQLGADRVRVIILDGLGVDKLVEFMETSLKT
jgi:hypothetical protein